MITSVNPGILFWKSTRISYESFCNFLFRLALLYANGSINQSVCCPFPHPLISNQLINKSVNQSDRPFMVPILTSRAPPVVTVDISAVVSIVDSLLVYFWTLCGFDVDLVWTRCGLDVDCTGTAPSTWWRSLDGFEPGPTEWSSRLQCERCLTVVSQGTALSISLIGNSEEGHQQSPSAGPAPLRLEQKKIQQA